MDGADGVYPSSEDTYLLVDALTNDEDLLQEASGLGGICIEVGCGTGEVTKTLSSLLRNKCVCICTDVNQLAVLKTRELLKQNNDCEVDIIACDLFTGFKPGTKFDVIVFNPPYVPTDEDELQRAIVERDISASWAGGKDGREVIDRFLSTAVTFLGTMGVIYLVVLEANSPTLVVHFAEKHGLIGTISMKRKAGIEVLYVLRFRKATR